MFKILVVEHIHPAGEALLAQKAEISFPPAAECGWHFGSDWRV